MTDEEAVHHHVPSRHPGCVAGANVQGYKPGIIENEFFFRTITRVVVMR